MSDTYAPTEHASLERMRILALCASALYGVFTLLGVVDVAMVARVAPAVLDPSQAQASQALFADYRSYITALYIPKLIMSGFALTVYLAWLHSAYRNIAEVLDGVPGTNPSMAVASHFLPFANLYLPYKYTKEAWDAAEPAPRGFVIAWWVLCVASVITLRYAGMSMSERVIALAILTFHATTDLSASLMTVLLVGRVTRAQQRAVRAKREDAPEAKSQGTPPGA